MIKDYISSESFVIDEYQPWTTLVNLDSILNALMTSLGNDFEIKHGVAIYKTAVTGHNVNVSYSLFPIRPQE